MEQSPPSDLDGISPKDHARVREISARIFEEYVRLRDRSPRKVADRLAELGWFGRGGKRFDESTVAGWRKGEYAPTAFVMIAVLLDAGLSFDEVAYGSGLKAEVDRLGEQVAQSRRDLRLLAHALDQLVQPKPEPVATAIRRIAQPNGEPA